MHASLAELLENLNPGLLWVTRDGVVRYANGEAAQRTGLAAGRKIYDPDLVRAVAMSVAGRLPRTVTAVGGGGAAGSELKCRVIPGLAQDDAFVLIGANPGLDHGSGFDNLMQAIRSDLQAPLRQAEGALQVAAANRAEPAALDALLDDVSQVLSVVDKLVELAGLWNSGALFATDRIELWPLLQQVWAEAEPLALDRGVKVRFRAQSDTSNLATLYGSERWLARVLQECLEAAVRGSRRGATLEIEHRQMGPRALIVFRDCGMFAARAPEAVDLAAPRRALTGVPSRLKRSGVSAWERPGALTGVPSRLKRSGVSAWERPGALTPAAAAPRAPAREQIGFRLCQHIVSLHGGHLREEIDDGVRNFLVELPTGAPHHDDQHQLDIAQAQRYASDLAALMTRARKRSPAPPESAVEPSAG